jgi:hypothetical protein
MARSPRELRHELRVVGSSTRTEFTLTQQPDVEIDLGHGRRLMAQAVVLPASTRPPSRIPSRGPGGSFKIAVLNALVVAIFTAAVPHPSRATIILDPVGDAISAVDRPGVPPVDITRASGEFSETTLFFEAEFAPGTLNLSDAMFAWTFDSDFDPASGLPPEPALDTDSFVFFNSTYSRQWGRIVARLYGNVPGGFVAELPLITEPNRVAVEVPLALLGSISGRVPFSFDSALPINENAGEFSDIAGLSSPFDRLEFFTSPVPEPATGDLLLAGLLSLALRQARIRRCRQGAAAECAAVGLRFSLRGEVRSASPAAGQRAPSRW